MASQRSIGAVTAGATGGASVGYAVAEIIVWYAGERGVDMSSIEGAMGLVMVAALGLLGGYLVPSKTPGDHA